MKALVKTKPGKGHILLKEIKEPSVGRNEVKIKVMATGICGTDIKIKNGNAWSNPPVILGHEFSGEVVEIGGEVRNIKIGDRVVSETPQVVCGNCHYCHTNNYMMCPERLSIGYGVNGAFANYCVVREALIHKLPDNISFDSAALCEPAAVAVHATLEKIDIKPTDNIIVMGPGTIGLLVAQILKNTGSNVILTGTSSDMMRLKTAKELGIDITLDVTQCNLKQYINIYTNGKGADYVYDCTGEVQAIRDGMSILKKNGTLIQVGLTEKLFEIEYSLIPNRELSIIGSFGHNWSSWNTAIELLSKYKINTKKLITQRLSINEWEKGFQLAEEQKGIKILLHPNK